jgi:Protein of unknown function (DUF642)
MGKTLKALALIVGLGVAQNASADNLLVNGGFETPVQGGPLFAAFNVPAGSPLITGWNVVQGNVDLTNTCCYGPGPNTLNPSSMQDVDLIGDANGSGGVFGGLSQSFATIPGQLYRLTFDYSHNNGTFSPDYAVQVTVADANAPANTIFSVEQSQPFFFGVSFPTGGWQTFSQNFTAISNFVAILNRFESPYAYQFSRTYQFSRIRGNSQASDRPLYRLWFVEVAGSTCATGHRA